MSERACLLVGLEPAPRDALRQTLDAYGIRPVVAASGAVAVDLLRNVAVDVIVCRAPRTPDGYIGLLRALALVSDAPALLLTPAADEVDCILALEFGAADVLPAHASPRLLAAKIRRLFRTADVRGPGEPRRVITAGALTLDVASSTARFDDRLVGLTIQQFDTLVLLASQPGRLVSRETISRAVRGIPIDDSRSVDVTVSRLRRRLNAVGAHSISIGALYGRGYYLDIVSGGEPGRSPAAHDLNGRAAVTDGP
jgi:DNA-binding response OmpR family regulator